MIPESTQLDLFGNTANEPALLQPVANCDESPGEIRNRSPTEEYNSEELSKQRAKSLQQMSLDLVKKSFNKTKP